MFYSYTKIKITAKPFVLLLLSCTLPTLAFAFGEGEWNSEMATEGTFFAEESETSDTRSNFSVLLTTEYFEEWNDGADSLVFVPRVRLDQHDPERNSFDIRELVWVHVEDTWEIRTGVQEIAWGVSFMGGLVDVVNQTSMTDDLFGSKLGQPMVNLSLVQDWGILGLYVLAGFRQATLPGPDSRPGLPFEIATDETEIPLSHREVYGLDYALRWQHAWESFEWALSYFYGTSRDADIDFNYDIAHPGIVSTYSQVQQLGIELIYIWNGYNFKLESKTLDGASERDKPLGMYTAALIGFEYTWDSVFGSDYSVMWDVSYNHDDRKNSLVAIMEKDITALAVLNFNDEFDTRIALGTIWDVKDDEGILFSNAARRLSEYWKIDLMAIYFLAEQKATPPEVTEAQTEAELAVLLAGFELFGNSDLEKMVDSFGRLVTEYGAFSPEVSAAIDNLQTIVDGVSLRTDNKLGMLEDESFIRVVLTHYF